MLVGLARKVEKAFTNINHVNLFAHSFCISLYVEGKAL